MAMILTMLKRAISTLIAVLMLLSNGLNTIFNGKIYEYESIDKVIGLETLDRTQGVTTDGKSWIFSGKKSLTRVSLDNKTILASNKKPFKGFEEYAVDHIGGISYYNGYVYASFEDSKVWNSPIVAIFDAQTLTFTGRSVLLDTEKMFRGCPWVCCDEQNGLFYVANSRNTTEIYCYDLETLEYVKTIQLKGEIEAIQGAEMYKGIMYAATNDSTRAVYQINLETGEITKYFDRIMYQPKLIDNFGGEGEDITVLEMEDGTVFHALDLGVLFIDSNLRHYKPIEN